MSKYGRASDCPGLHDLQSASQPPVSLLAQSRSDYIGADEWVQLFADEGAPAEQLIRVEVGRERAGEAWEAA